MSVKSITRVGICAALCLGASPAPAAPPPAEEFHWVSLPDLPMGVAAPAASISGNRLVVTGGIVLSDDTTDLVQVMDLTTYTWTATFHLRQPRWNHAQITLDDGRILVVGGYPHGKTDHRDAIPAYELIDPLTGEVRASDLKLKIRSPSLNKLDDGRIAVVGEQAVYLYDPAQDQWSEPIALNQRRLAHASILTGPRKLLVIGGTGMRTFERVDLRMLAIAYDTSPALPLNLDDMRACLLPDGRLWIVGGQYHTGITTDRTWLVSLDAAGDPLAVEDGPALGLAAGISDHALIETDWGLVAVGGESENAQRLDVELRQALLLDPHTLAVRRLPDTQVPHDDAAAVAWAGSLIILGGQAPGSLLGMAIPTPVRRVEMLRRR